MMRKTLRTFLCWLTVLNLTLLSSCALIEIRLPETTVPASTTETETEHVIPPQTDRYTVVFDENESFPTEAARKASARIDTAILEAVKLLNTVDEEPIQILDCDYSTRPKQRDSLKDPLSKTLYDQVLEKVLQFEDYHFYAKDYPDKDFFSVFVSAMDALRIDRTDLFLYSDLLIDGVEYRSGYFMPGDNFSRCSDDREAIRNEVDVCNAVVDRIISKMPEGLSNYEKCCYFTFVLAAANTYDHSDPHPMYDYQAYAAFVKGQAICSGYAQAFYRLCREAGISCWYCRGTTPTDRHAWNMLDTADGPVYVDVTWYDTDDIREHYRDGKEAYLFMTQEDFDFYGYTQETCQ